MDNNIARIKDASKIDGDTIAVPQEAKQEKISLVLQEISSLKLKIPNAQKFLDADKKRLDYLLAIKQKAVDLGLIEISQQ